MILFDYARILIRRWWLLVLPVVLIGGITALSYQPPASSFQVKVRFAVGLPPEQVPDVYNFDRHYDWLASEYFTRGIQDILNTGKFGENVAARLPKVWQLSPQQIVSAIRSDYRASVIDIYVGTPNAEHAVGIAQAVIDELTQNGEAYWPQLTNAKAPLVRPLDKPVPVPVSIDLRNRFDLPVRLALGLGLGVLLAFIAHYFDRVVRDKHEVQAMGVDVIGEIPGC
jgi:capsular polysaccharide biosynthesis protein